ncbi:hypothetical protein BJ165DRAFT_1493848, partial [Panaeolus papilionaceus]
GRYSISTSATSPCILTATKNVVGRYINGVERGEVCWTEARVGRDGLRFESSYLGGSDEMNSGIYDDINPRIPDTTSSTEMEESREQEATSSTLNSLRSLGRLRTGRSGWMLGGEVEVEGQGEQEGETLGDVVLRG